MRLRTAILILVGAAGLMALSFSATSGAPHSRAQTSPSLSLNPAQVLQGDSSIISVSSTDLSNVKSILFENRKLTAFSEQGAVKAYIGVDLNHATGTLPVIVNLKNGVTLNAALIINPRPQKREDLNVPPDFGGNTPTGIQNLLAVLARNNKSLDIITRVPTPLNFTRGAAFAYPVRDITVTNTYGVVRTQSGSALPHKGTDFRGPVGTPIYAINRGVVRVSRFYAAYGNTVIVDHGAGVYSMYMHMSQSRVKVGQVVAKGALVGSSGDTGYTNGPHLHLTIRVNGVSVDPVQFLTLFGNPAPVFKD